MKEFKIGKMEIKLLEDATLHQSPFEAFEFVISKENVGPNLHMHHTFDEMIDMVSGTLEVKCGEDVRILKEGDRMLLPRNIPHIWKTLSPVKMVVIFSPSSKQVEFFTKLEDSIKNKISWDETISNLSKEFDVYPL